MGGPADTEHDPRLARLVALLTDEAVRALGLGSAPAPIRRLVELIFRYPAFSLARDLVRFDTAVADGNARAASERLLARLVPDSSTSGFQDVPRQGPVLFVANHPGLFDAIALLAALPRDDLRVVALDHPFTEALPALRQRIITVPPRGKPRSGVVRAMAGHLSSGGAVLTFPAGTIEPDPAVRDGAEDSIAGWTPVADLLVGLVPDLVVVPVVVAGVQTRRGLEHPLTRLRRSQEDRDWLGAVLQMLIPWLRTPRVTVDAGAPLTASGTRGSLADAAARSAMALVRERSPRGAANATTRPPRGVRDHTQQAGSGR